MEIICELGGLKGIYTNHSRKQRRATQIYMAGVDEQEILAKSGHMYEKKTVLKYKQSSTKIQQKVAYVLNLPPTTYVMYLFLNVLKTAKNAIFKHYHFYFKI